MFLKIVCGTGQTSQVGGLGVDRNPVFDCTGVFEGNKWTLRMMTCDPYTAIKGCLIVATMDIKCK